MKGYSSGSSNGLTTEATALEVDKVIENYYQVLETQELKGNLHDICLTKTRKDMEP